MLPDPQECVLLNISEAQWSWCELNLHIYSMTVHTVCNITPKNAKSKAWDNKDNVGPHNWPSSSYPLTWQNSYSNNHETKWKKSLIKFKNCMIVVTFTVVTVQLMKGIISHVCRNELLVVRSSWKKYKLITLPSYRMHHTFIAALPC